MAGHSTVHSVHFPMYHFIGVIEFICSRVPYAMKGVIIGAQYTLLMIFSIPTLAIVLLFQQDLSI